MPRQSGQQYVDKKPGSFQDCSPNVGDANLINKRRQAEGRAAGSRRLPALTDVDYLVGVTDATRQGDLRFTHLDGRELLDPAHAVPQLISLPELLNSADKVTEGGDDMAAVKALLEAGSGSLGGARPRASVQRDDGSLLRNNIAPREQARFEEVLTHRLDSLRELVKRNTGGFEKTHHGSAILPKVSRGV